MPAPKGNKYALGLDNSGRPPIWSNEDIELFNKRITEYFEYISEQNENPTITGLTLYLGFSNKKTLYEYAKKEVFSNCIKRALTIVENFYESKLIGQSPTGAIFALKNMDWSDKSEMDNNIIINGELASLLKQYLQNK